MNKLSNIVHPQNFLFLTIASLLIFAPLMRAGNSALALMIMQLLGLISLAIVVWYNLAQQTFPRAIWWFVGISVGLSALYLLPIPAALWQALPGRSLYNEVYVWLNNFDEGNVSLTLSLIPTNTAYSLLALLPPLAAFVAIGSLDKQQTLYTVYVLLGIAAFQAAWGLTQYAAGFSDNASGTYPNRDHFSALMVMTLPLAIALTASSVGNKRHHHRHTNTQTSQEQRVNQTLIFASLTLLILIAGIFSRSRAGVALLLLAILITSLAFARHIGGKRSAGVATSIATIGLGIASSIGLIPVLNRFIQVNPIEDERWRISEITLTAIQQFFPVGTGPGTFADVYRAFQPLEQAGFVNNAHNDYLELLLETGVIGVVILLMFLLLYIYGWLKLYKQAWTTEHFIKTGAGIGIFLMLIHAALDFNFHIPANMTFFAVLAALFFKKPAATG